MPLSDSIQLFRSSPSSLILSYTTAWLRSLPPATKAYGTICLLFAIVSQLGILHPSSLALDYSLVFEHFQIWRLFTTFFYLGNLSLNFVIRLLMLVKFGAELEQGPLAIRRTRTFLHMMIFGALIMLVLSSIPGVENRFLSISLVTMLLCVWSRGYSNVHFLYGRVTINANSWPFIALVFNILYGYSAIPNLVGLVVGHLYLYLVVRLPVQSRWGIGARPVAARARP